MKSTLLLMQLQQLDNEINRLIVINKKILSDINDRSYIIDLEDKLKQSVGNLNSAKEYSIDLDSKTQTLRNKMEQFSASLFGGNIQNSKELTSLQTEISNIKKLISSYEDEQMSKWEEIENFQSVVYTLDSQLKSITAIKNLSVEDSNREYDHNLQEIEKLNLEKRGIRDQISKEYLEIYDRLFVAKKGYAVSMIEDSCCTGCGTTLTPSERQQAKNHSSMIHCPNCGRILYAD